MDAMHFDRFARSLVTGTTRRTTLALGLGGILATFGQSEAAKKKRKRKKRKKRCKACGACHVCRKGKCKPLPFGTPCEDDRICRDGVCSCPFGLKACQDGCIPEDFCCDDAECGSGGACLANGSCATSCELGACGVDCACGAPSIEGPAFCGIPTGRCENIPQECASTADCPLGEVCLVTSCDPGPNRCAKLCPV